MKAVKNIIAVVALSLLSLNALASNHSGKSIRAITNEIQNNISITSTKSGSALKVDFTFTVDKNGKVNAVAAGVSNKNLRSDLEQQFSKLSFSGLEEGLTYTVSVNFLNY